MKKLIFLILIIPSFCFSQISINSQHMPQSGDTLRYSIALVDTAILFNYAATGANINWNFDSLVPQRQGIHEYEASSQTPYGFFVPNKIGEKLGDTLNIGPAQLINVYEFYQKNTNGFTKTDRGFTLGALPFPIAQAYQDPDEVYQFPLNYQDRDSSNFEFTFSNQFAQVYLQNKGYRINNVEAWGTLKTPYGTFSCIKVVTDIVSTDTVSFGGTNFGLTSHRREYKWLSPQLRIPALSLSGAVIGGIFIPSSVEYRDSLRNVPSVLSPTALFMADSTEVPIGSSVKINNLSISLLNASYRWDIQPLNYIYVNGTNANTDSIVVQFTDTGFYDVQLIARNSQGSDTLLRTQYIKVVSPTSIEEKQFDSKVGVYPNPVIRGDLVQIKFKDNFSPQILSIIDINGKTIFEQQLNANGNKYELETDYLKQGFYLIHAIEGNQSVSIPLIIK